MDYSQNPRRHEIRGLPQNSFTNHLLRFLLSCRTPWYWKRFFAYVVSSYLCSFTTLLAASADKATSFETQILPIFKSKCVVCHGANSPQQGLDLRSKDAILKGGKSGPAIQVGSSEKSLLMEKIVRKQMPPSEPKLTNEEIEAIRAWIDRGASADVREAKAVGPPLTPQVTEEDVL